MAILVASVPLLWVFRILSGLPDPLQLSRRRWPTWGNFLLIASITANVAEFIRFVYAGGSEEPLTFVLRFLIALVIYLFGFSLLVGQFAGLYPEYFVTTGRSGLGMRKALYGNVVRVEESRSARGETELVVHMRSRERLYLALPTRHLVVLRDAVRKHQPPL